MQQHMRLMGHRLLEILLIHGKYILILMGETKLRLLIQAIEVLSAIKGKLLAVVNRLAAASHTSSWTCHDFHKIIMHLTTLNLIKQRTCISKTADYRCPDLHIINRKFCFSDTVIRLKFWASDRLKRICRRILLLEQIMGRAKGRLHNEIGRAS